MNQPDPLGVLSEEHRTIEVLLDALDLCCASFPPWPLVQDIVDMLVRFADEEHHAKEEKVVFPALVRAGLPERQGPVACMLHEHDDGREYVRQIRAALAQADEGAFHTAAQAYIRLLREHIHKEDMILFPLARQRVGARLMEEMRTHFPSGPAEDARLETASARANELLQRAHLEADTGKGT